MKALLLAVFLASLGPLAAAEDDSPSPAASPQVSTNSEESMRVYILLQEQLRSLQQRLEQNQGQADRAAEKNLEVLAARLQAIESSMANQRSKEIEVMRDSNRAMLVAAATFAAIAFLAVLVMTYFQWRTINRLSDISTGFPPNRLLGAGSMAETLALAPGGAVDNSSQRLRGALQQLEKRIVDLEHPESSSAGSPGSRHGEDFRAPTRSNVQENGDNGASHQRVQVLVGRGQILLNIDKPADALKSFEEALELDPGNAELMVKRGMALERMERVDEAIACYNQAISMEPTLTVAYLCKGGLCNRTGRNTEALECYEKALRSKA